MGELILTKNEAQRCADASLNNFHEAIRCIALSIEDLNYLSRSGIFGDVGEEVDEVENSIIYLQEGLTKIVWAGKGISIAQNAIRKIKDKKNDHMA